MSATPAGSPPRHPLRPFLLAVAAALAASPARAPAPEFERDVPPILTPQCLNCHGGLRQRGGLDLRTVEGIAKAARPARRSCVSGKPDESLLWKKVEKDEMPDALLKLPSGEKKVLKVLFSVLTPETQRRQPTEYQYQRQM